MRKNFPPIAAGLLSLGLAVSTPVLAAPDVAALRTQALADKVAWDIVEGLTTEIGPRQAASPKEALARQWAVAKLKSLGFANVHIEDFKMTAWVRGHESAAITAPFQQPLAITALGASGSTGPNGIDGEVVFFSSLAALKAAPDGSLKGKIAYVTHAMQANQDGSGYGPFGNVRRQGPAIAAKKGAAAIVIKSIGTDHHRVPHTGVTNFGDAAPIPAGAISVPDAENLERMFQRGKPIKMHLVLETKTIPDQPGGNVVAEVPGSDPNAGVIIVAGHLDSWDLGTGAIDDGAGVAIVAAAAKQIMAAGQPRHTIRILWAGAEEPGGLGGDAYYAAHKNEKVSLVMESDFGADRVWSLVTKLADGDKAVGEQLTAALEPLGIVMQPGQPYGGEDVGKFAEAGAPVIDLRQDGTRYFDLHHTPDDTLDKIDPAQLQQNVAAWTTVLAIMANQP